MDKIISESAVLEAISRIGLFKSDTKEVQAVAECLRAVEALSPVNPQPRYYPPCEDCHKKMNEIRKAYDKIQSVEPKIGHWINAKVGMLFPSNDFKCSKCGNILDFNGVNCGRGDANYCPNCGADMRGEQE